MKKNYQQVCLILVAFSVLQTWSSTVHALPSQPIVIIDIDGPISPATDDFLKTSLEKAHKEDAQLLIIRLNTPGGLVPSMQTMVKTLLDASLPTVVYVSPSGASATSAGVFVTLAANFAVMAPGTTIGAAHPVSGGGEDISGDMRAKVENFAVSLIKAIAEQRGRNTQWAEKAVRKSVSITDREALKEKVIDFIAPDLGKLLGELEGRKVTLHNSTVTFSKLSEAPQQVLQMSFKQKVINVLADPNITILLGMGAMFCIMIELYHPGTILPGIIGSICLVLALTSAQVLPISLGGLTLLLLGGIFFAVELFMPSFGIWGIAGIICLVLGSIYLIDTDFIWGSKDFTVDKTLVGTVAAVLGSILLGFSFLVVGAQRRQVATGKEGMIDKVGVIKGTFEQDEKTGFWEGKILLGGEYWKARLKGREPKGLMLGDKVKVTSVEDGLVVVVEPL